MIGPTMPNAMLMMNCTATMLHRVTRQRGGSRRGLTEGWRRGVVHRRQHWRAPRSVSKRSRALALPRSARMPGNGRNASAPNALCLARGGALWIAREHEVREWKMIPSSRSRVCCPMNAGSPTPCATSWCRRSSMSSKHGLPGGHHFYISFRTDYPGVVIPPRLRAQYPEEMTIVLQHQFWDLKLDHEARTISVGSVVRRRALDAGDPAGRADLVRRSADPLRVALRTDRAGGAKSPRWRAVRGEPEPEPSRSREDTPAPQVVSLDAFRRRTPPKT